MDAYVSLELAIVGEGHVAVRALELLRALLACVERLELRILGHDTCVLLLHQSQREGIHAKGSCCRSAGSCCGCCCGGVVQITGGHEGCRLGGQLLWRHGRAGDRECRLWCGIHKWRGGAGVAAAVVAILVAGRAAVRRATRGGGRRRALTITILAIATVVVAAAAGQLRFYGHG